MQNSEVIDKHFICLYNEQIIILHALFTLIILFSYKLFLEDFSESIAIAVTKLVQALDPPIFNETIFNIVICRIKNATERRPNV